MRKNEPYAIEMASREEVDEVLNRRIRSTAELAYYHSQFWRRKFDQLGLKPEDIQNQESLLEANRKGLRITKDELLRDFPSLVTDLVPDLYVEELWTSGSTGLPRRTWYSKDDFKRSADQVKLLYNAMDLSPGDYVMNLFSPAPNASGALSKEAAKELGLHMVHISVRLTTEQILQLIKLRKPQSFWALNSRAYQIPAEMKELGEDASKLGIESVLTGGEPSTKNTKTVMERKWNAPVIDCLASCEISVFGYQTLNCGTDVMHAPENRLLLNFVDPKTLDPVSKEEKGIDLISTLYDIDEKPAVILLGHSHGDLGRILDSTECNCGRTYKQMEWPVFRNDYIVKIAGQNTYPVMGTEAAIVDSPFLTGEYTSITKGVSESSIRPYLEIRVETRGPIPENERKKLEQKIWCYVISNPGAESIVNSNADFVLKFIERGRLYEGLEKYLKPGKPIRLIRM